MYVNKYFEKVTGYSRLDVLGKNCKFLQCEQTDKNEVLKLSTGLALGQSAVAILDNRTFLGRQYKNLVAIKPVHDAKGQYRYVIGIQIDVSREVDECVSKLKLADSLMSMLPSTLIEDDDDE